MFMFSICMAGAWGAQEVLKSLELELQVPVSHYVVLATKPGSSAKAASAHNLSHLSGPSDINPNLPRPSTWRMLKPEFETTFFVT